MTKSLTKREAADFLKDRDGFAIVTHRRPDGDTVGSAALLCRGLRQLGKKAVVLENKEVTARYSALVEGLTGELPGQGCVVCVDVASGNMLPDSFAALKDRIELRIDHHGKAESFTPLELVEPETAACGETVYELLCAMGVKLDKPMADALYTAVSTDTGCFRYANTTAHSFETAAACAAAGADVYGLNQRYFETNSLNRLRVQGYLTEKALFLQQGKVVICALPLAVEREMGLTEDDLDNISGFPRTIEGVKIAATLREQADGLIKMSVRAVPGCDAAAICAEFGGGGHKGAAGASIRMTMEEAVQALIRVIPEVE